jgi:exodeoxyribonuclease-5
MNQTTGFFLSQFGMNPNAGQRAAFESLAQFVDPQNPDTCFILTGPAGSGKTSLLRSVIAWMEDRELDFSLTAPTGRAAQIAGKKAGCSATTMHRLLFTISVNDDPLQVTFNPRINQHHDDIRYFIIDEASMVGDDVNREGIFVNQTSLLGQLFRFVKQGNPRNKIIFVGDQYQLPPVNATISPALTPGYLMEKYQVAAKSVALQTVERTSGDSYILDNARHILGCMNGKRLPDALRYQMAGSFSGGIQKYLNDFPNEPFNRAIMIALSNNQVNALNTWVRNFRFSYPREKAILPGELMICNNNTEIDDHLLYKGSHFLVKGIWRPEELAGLNFINAEIEFDNHRNERVKAKTKILVDSVISQDGSIPYDKERGLLHEAYRRNRKFRESKRLTDDAFVNALRARHGYAITAHKAQGGEWDHVYIHPGYRKDDLRWIYTAMTRAKREVYTWNDK